MVPPLMNTHRANGLGHSPSQSQYSLNSVNDTDDHAPLISPATPSYGATFPRSPTPAKPSSSRIILYATLKMAAIFVLSTVLLGSILYIALPTLQESDRDRLRIPKSFDQLKDLNTLLKKYRDIYPYRIIICYVVTYLFLQAFSLPGSMYLSILGGALWGVLRALPLVCVCVATGATLCYLISAALGPALLTLPRFKSRLEKWSEKIQAHKENIISFLIVLRIAPLPPHWVVNVICPHIGIDIGRFWLSTALGIFGVSVIHTTIGGSLDEMTSAADFKLISWKNFFMLSAIAVGVLIPVGLRYWFRSEVADVALVGEEAELGAVEVVEEGVGANPNSLSSRKSTDSEVLEAYYDDESEDDDIVLEAGPALSPTSKTSPNPLSPGNNHWR